jgi:hypothetical protein
MLALHSIVAHISSIIFFSEGIIKNAIVEHEKYVSMREHEFRQNNNELYCFFSVMQCIINRNKNLKIVLVMRYCRVRVERKKKIL